MSRTGRPRSSRSVVAVLTAALGLAIAACEGSGDPDPTDGRVPPGSGVSQDGRQAGPGAGRLDRVDVQLGWLMNSQTAALAVGIEEGIFEKYGIRANILQGGPNIDPVQNVASGRAQFGVVSSNGSLILARSRGMDLKAVGAFYQKHPFAYFWKPGAGITGPEDLRGKRIGIPATARYLLMGLLSLYDMTEADVTIVPIFDMTPLAVDRVDVITGWVVDVGQRAAVPEVEWFLSNDVGIPNFGNVIFTTERVIARNRDLVQRFVNAIFDAHDVAMSDPNRAVEATMRHARDLDAELELASFLASMPLWTSELVRIHGLGYMDPQVWEGGQEILIETGQQSTRIDVADVFTNEFINNTPKR